MHTDTNLLDRHLPSRTSLPPREGEEDTPDDLGAFGWLRGIRDRAIFLELRRKDGSIVARPYAWLAAVDYDPSDGISLRFGAEKFKITGRNLNAEVRPNLRLLNGILRQRVPWIQEADRPMAMAAGKDAVVIETIAIG